MCAEILIIFISAVCLLIASCSNTLIETGTIRGNIRIGPLVPVAQPGVTLEVLCEVYEARKILVYEKNGKDLVKEVVIGCDGSYRAELALGFYVIDINRIGIDHSSKNHY
ncbi:hypothetical protein ACFLUJ_07475 [Chloroflexota bacterium]